MLLHHLVHIENLNIIMLLKHQIHNYMIFYLYVLLYKVKGFLHMYHYSCNFLYFLPIKNLDFLLLFLLKQLNSLHKVYLYLFYLQHNFYQTNFAKFHHDVYHLLQDMPFYNVFHDFLHQTQESLKNHYK